MWHVLVCCFTWYVCVCFLGGFCENNPKIKDYLLLFQMLVKMHYSTWTLFILGTQNVFQEEVEAKIIWKGSEMQIQYAQFFNLWTAVQAVVWPMWSSFKNFTTVLKYRRKKASIWETNALLYYVVRFISIYQIKSIGLKWLLSYIKV